jgi:4-hydroxy-tetrahydrodipicolinate reductase
VHRVAKSLGANFTVSVEETHHIHKKDAPSGTALKLGETVAAARGLSQDDIHYEVERRGEVPGDHAVIFESTAERIVLSHSVTTRDVFAEGALRAARWVVAQPAGLYSMHDVLIAAD